MRIAHIAGLRTIGGVEHHLAQFIRASSQRYGTRHAVCATSGIIHPHIIGDIRDTTHAIYNTKIIAGLKLPRRVPLVRGARARWIARQLHPDIALFWNRLGAGRSALIEARAFKADRCVYWDRGAAWLAEDKTAARRFLSRMRCVLANSYASKRMLELRWNYSGDIHICRNALRPDLTPPGPIVKTLPGHRAIRIGVAGRLVAVKGIASCLHSIEILRRQGLAVELHIAGTGPLEAKLRTLAERLGIEKHVVFHGLVADMATFYTYIDCLLHLALREPFGGVIVEAMAHGCPVVATRVDGIAEIIDHDGDGFLIEPELDTTAYAELGGDTHELPERVYEPATDRIAPPRAVDPIASARALQTLFESAVDFEHASQQAHTRAVEEFSHSVHVDRVLDKLEHVVGPVPTIGSMSRP